MALNDDAVCFSGLDPVLEQMGGMVGLLETDPAGSGGSRIIPGWFEDPISSTSQGIQSNPKAFAELLETLLGQVAGHALGVPAKSPGMLGSWYPIPNPKTQEPTGLYVVSYPDPNDPDRYVFGLGVLHQWKIPSTDTAIEVDAYGLVPLIRLGGGDLAAVIGTNGYPITVGVSLAGTQIVDGKLRPLVEAGAFSFNGVKLSAALDAADTRDPFHLSVVVLSLQLPGDTEPADRSLANLLSITGEQIIQTGASLLVTALSRVLDDAPDGPTQYLLPIFGLSSSFPGSVDLPALPPLRWDRLLSAHGQGDVGAPFRDWFRTLAADPGLVKTWLTAIGGLTGNLSIPITGSGSRADPLLAPILSVEAVGVLSFTVGTAVDDDGNRSFYPGLRFGAEAIVFQSSSDAVDATLTLAGDLELAEFVLSGGGAFADPSSLSFAVGFTLAGGTVGTPLVSYGGYACDSLRGGVALGSAGGSLRVVPLFELTGVEIPDSSLGTVNLLSPASLSNAASETLVSAVNQALEAIFDLSGNAVAARSAAALLGIVAPPTPSGWSIAPPFSADRLVDSLADPVGALASYYQAVISAPAEGTGDPPFTAMLQACAALLSAAPTSTTISVTGAGTRSDPWTASLQSADATLPAHIIAWKTADGDSVRSLSFALTIAPEIAAGETRVVPAAVFHLLDLQLDSSGISGGVWLPGLSLEIGLPNGFETPAIADASFAITNASLAAGWQRSGGWFWSLAAGQPSLTIGADPPMQIGKDLNFGDKSSLDDLVTAQADTFAPIFLGLMGLALLRAETRPGLAFTALAGLLPDVSGAPNYPSGLTWPAIAPLSPSDLFTDPRKSLRDRVNALFATQETASAAMSLLSWAMSPTMDAAPSIAGTTDFAAPLCVPVGSSGFDVIVWYSGAGPSLGLGLGRTAVSTIDSKLGVTITSRLNAIEVSLATGAVETGGNAPSASCAATLCGVSGPLVAPTAGGALGSLELGFSLALADGAIVVEPVVTLLDVQLPGGSKRDQLTLADFLSGSASSELQQAFLSLLNQAVVATATSAATKDGFRTLYGLLQALGLALPRPHDASPYGIEPGGWSALLADPTGFLSARLVELLADPGLRGELFALVRSVLGVASGPTDNALGVSLSGIPTPVLALLEALGFVGGQAQGYPVLPSAVLELANAPFATLQARAGAVATDAGKRATLLAALLGQTSVAFPQDRPLFEMSLVEGTSIRVATLDGAFLIGEVLGIAGSVELDLADLTFCAKLDLAVEPVGLTLESSIGARFGSGASAPGLSVQMLWGSRPQLPAPVPLTIYPFDARTFLGQVIELAPVYALDVMTGAALQSELVEQYPLPRIILQGLGMVTGPSEGPWSVPSLAGLLRDPLAWLLSDQVLGDDGRFSLGSAGKVIQRLAAAAPDGWESANHIKVLAASGSLQVSGLPYGLSVSVAVDDARFQLGVSTGGFAIAGASAELKTLSAGITLGADYQPGFVGGIELGSTAGDGWFVRAGYQGGFDLGIGQGQSDTPSGFQLDILPFQGWGDLAEQATRIVAPKLLEQVVPQLVSGLEQRPSTKAFAQKLQTLGAGLDLADLVDRLAATSPFTAQNIEQAALAWLLARFDEGDRATTADTVVSLFEGLLPAGAVSAQAGLIAYQPSDKIPVRFQLGVDPSNNLGLWADLDLPADFPVKAAITPTGIGIPLGAPATPVFSFGVTITVPVEDGTGPQLGLSFEDGKLVVGLDPIGDSTDPASHSPLYRQLLPELFPQQAGESPDLGQRILDWTVEVVTQVLPRYVSVVVLDLEPVRTWLDTQILASGQGPTPATILVDTHLLTQAGSPPTYALNSLENLLAIEPLAFLANLIKALLSEHIVVATFADGKGTVTVGKSPVNDSAFGLRFAVSDLAFEKLPYVVFQLGATDNDWIKDAGGDLDKLSDALGVSAYVPVSGDGADMRPHFDQLELNLINVGLDVVGRSQQPLVDLSRFQLGGVKPRGLVAIQLDQGVKVTAYGGVATLSDMMLSLAPNTLTATGGGNPIAQNLLGAGTDAKEQNPPANPSFSVTAGYFRNLRNQKGDGGLYVHLGGAEAGENKVVVQVQRSFGPLHVDSVGLGWEQTSYRLDVLFTGNVALAGLEADLVGLTIGVPVRTITDLSKYELQLEGLDVSFKGGPVTISGGLLKTETPELMYTGAALIKAAQFSIVGVGSYSQVPTGKKVPAKSPSLFIFAALSAPLGGVPAFFVTGVAAGFGYNRSLDLPSVGTVQDFPLVSGVKYGSFTEGESADSVLQVLNEVISPAVGQYWLAAGITFTTYKLLDTLALVFVKFGRGLEIDLLGLSSAALPPEIPKSKALAYIELAIKVAIDASAGVVSVEAQLTPNSYVITKDCKLTGGFAFYLWLKNQTAKDGTLILAGDFVITLGGYHPAFKAPSYYPVVPRLGFKWLLAVGDVGKIDIDGGAYFALVPTAIMAGGNLSVVFTMGPLKAWLLAAANFLIEWQPFYFDVEIKVSVGVSFHTEIAGVSVTLTVSLGADLQLMGPPTHGKAKISWYVISFTIPIGSDKSATEDKNLDWEAFSARLLPSAAKDSDATPMAEAMLAVRGSAASTDSPVGQQVVKIAASGGLVDGPGKDAASWKFQPVPFSIDVSSAIPISTLSVTGLADVQGSQQVGVRPMGKSTLLVAPLKVEILDQNGTPVDLKARNMSSTPSTSGAPAALWSRQALDRAHAPAADGMIVDGVLLSTRIAASDYVRIGTLQQFPIENLAYDQADGQLPYFLTPKYPASAAYPSAEQAQALARLKQSVMDAPAVSARNAILSALRSMGFDAPADPNLSVTATSADAVLQAPPTLARIGLYQTNGVVQETAPAVASVPAVRAMAAVAPAAQPELLGVRRTYCGPRTAAERRPADVGAKRTWTHCESRRKTRRLSDMAAAAGAGQGEVRVFDGTMFVWQLATGAAHEVEHEGDLSLRALCLDRYGDLLADQLVGRGTHRVPEGTQTLALEGNADPDADGIVGWTTSSVLTRLSDSVAVGHRFSLHMQNASRVRRRGTRVGKGLICAGVMARQNSVQSAGGRSVPGWVKTCFGSVTAFAIIVPAGEAPLRERLLVTLTQGDRPGEGETRLMENPDRVLSDADGRRQILIYRLASTSSYTTVMTRPLIAAAGVEGVLGCLAPPDTFADEVAGHELATAALDPLAEEVPRSKVVLRILEPTA